MDPTPSPAPGFPPLPADWSQFLPDTLVAVITGVAVAGALWVWDRGFAGRAARHAAERAWQAIRHQVADRYEFAERYRSERDLAPGALLRSLERYHPVVDLLTKHPIVEWQSAHPRREELRLALTLVTELPLVTMTARRLRDRIWTNYAYDIYTLGPDRELLDTATAYSEIRIADGGYHGMPPRRKSLKWLEKRHSTIVREVEAAELLDRFRNLRLQLDHTYDKLEELLRGDRRDGEPSGYDDPEIFRQPTMPL